MTEFKIKNKYLIGLCDWLSSLQLAGQQSRSRTKFVDLCIPRIAEIEMKKKAVTEKYVKKDENGTWLKKEIEKRVFWDIPDEKLDEFNSEFDAISEEFFAIEVNENKTKLQEIKKIVLTTDYKFGPGENDSIPVKQYKIKLAAEYDKWYEAFEQLEI